MHSLGVKTELIKEMRKIIDDPVKTFLSFLSALVMTIIIVLISTFLSFGMLFSFNHLLNQNCTPVDMTSFVNQNSSNLIGIFTNSLLTTGLVIFSAFSVLSAQRTLKQSQKGYQQLQKEQQIRDIERRLELFYIPAENIMKVADEYRKNPENLARKNEMIKYKRPITLMSTTHEEAAVMYTVDKLKEIGQYRYLATKETCILFTKCVYEEESSKNCTDLSESIEKDVKEYVKRLYELKQEE